MVFNICIDPPHRPKSFFRYEAQDIIDENGKKFPLFIIDRDSYVIQLNVQSGLNLDVISARHHIQIGKYSSLSDALTFMVDLNHEYTSIAQGEVSFLPDLYQYKRGLLGGGGIRPIEKVQF